MCEGAFFSIDYALTPWRIIVTPAAATRTIDVLKKETLWKLMDIVVFRVPIKKKIGKCSP